MPVSQRHCPGLSKSHSATMEPPSGGCPTRETVRPGKVRNVFSSRSRRGVLLKKYRRSPLKGYLFFFFFISLAAMGFCVVMFFMTMRVLSNCLSRRLTSARVVPLPAAMRLRRLPLMKVGFSFS